MPNNPLESMFTPREIDVLLLVGKHHTYEEIAKLLDISYETVKSYMTRLRHKLDIRRKSELAAWSRENEVYLQGVSKPEPKTAVRKRKIGKKATPKRKK